MTESFNPDSGTGQATPSRTKKFSDLDTAAEFRDVVAGIARTEINNNTSPLQKGRVVDVDFVNFTALVWFPGDAMPTKVNLFTSTLPGQWGAKFGSVSGDTSYVGKGSQVIVENFFNKLYVTEVLTGGQFSSEWEMAGQYDIAIGYNTLPEYARTSEWIFRPIWKGSSDPNLVGMGGPFAINIGPFVRDSNIDSVANLNDLFSLTNGSFEVEIVSVIGNRRYQFMADMNKWVGLIPATTPNGFGGSIDAWFRLMPNQVSNDANPGVGLVLNAKMQPWDAITNTPNLGDWDNSADTQTTVSLFTGSVAGHSSPAYIKMQSNTSHAVMKIQESATNRMPVTPGASYYPYAMINATVTTADVRVGVDWYDSSNAFISTATSGAVNCPANTWVAVFNAGGLTAPATAAYASHYVRMAGTPATTTIFYSDQIGFYENDNLSKSSVMLDVGLRKTLHSSKTNSVTNSAVDIWFRLYMPFIGKTERDQDITFVVKIKNMDSFLEAKSLKTGLPVFEYDLAPPDAVGYVGIEDAESYFSGSSLTNDPDGPHYSSSSGTFRNPDLLLGARGALTLSAGGDVTYDGTNLKWTNPFEIGGIGRSRLGLGLGYGTIACPTSGTIPVIPDPINNGTVTVTANGIPLSAGRALYYCVPPGVKTVALPAANYSGATLYTTGGFVIVDSANLPSHFTPPEWWVLIGYKAMTDNSFKCMDGNLYGGNVNVGDVNTHIIMPGTVESGDEVFGMAIVTAGTGASAPFGHTTVSYASLSGTGIVTVTLGANATLIGTDLVGYSYSAPTATSTILVINRASGAGTQVSYKIKRVP